jgi:hypothetical protein
MRGKTALTQADKFELRQFREAGVPIKLCAMYKNVSVATAMRALAELRERMGPEKLPARKRHLARQRVDTSQRASRSEK